LAIGVGLNSMYLILETLNEEKGIEHLNVYKNEYVNVSVEKANALFDQVPPHKARIESILNLSTRLDGLGFCPFRRLCSRLYWQLGNDCPGSLVSIHL
jgi:hypothetical protein